MVKKLSVITTVFNGEKSIERTIESVINQKYPNLEYILIDGASTDKTLLIVEKYKNYLSKIISEPDKGIYHGINKGLNLCTGDIIVCINSGDIFFEKAFITIARYFEQNNSLDFVFGTVLKKKLLYKYEPKKIWWSFNFYPAHSGGFFIKSESQKKIGLYNTKYPCSSDYDLFYKMIVKFKMKGTITKKNEIISKFDLGGYSSKLSLFEHMLEETNIRINNKQNKIIVLTIFILKFFKHYSKI
jgi:glycosyltransferase involved in cell wall biosynthesis